MEFDSALILKKMAVSNNIEDFSTALPFLQSSDLVSKLLSDFDIDVPNVLNRLIEIAEIPFALELPKAKIWLDYLSEKSHSKAGLSLFGKDDDILACYNAMISSVLIKAGRAKTKEVKVGINWIIKYQSFERENLSSWQGRRARKYGGCLKSTPCFIGLVKSTIALSDYIRATNSNETDLEKKLSLGLEYILNQNLFQKRTDSTPIRDYMTKLTYPFSYRTNIVELLALMRANNKINDERCKPAIDLLQKKRKKNGYWQVNSSYKPKAWIDFDQTGEKGLWITDFIERSVLKEKIILPEAART